VVYVGDQTAEFLIGPAEGVFDVKGEIIVYALDVVL